MIRALLIAIFLMCAPLAAIAQSGDVVRDRLVETLQKDGYREIRISNTFLGRLRFVATKPDMRREIVVNPSTGVILRDYVRFLDRDNDGPSWSGGGSGSSGSGRSGNDDDDDHDDDDDYDDDYDDDDYDDDDDDRDGDDGDSDSDDDDD